MDSRKGVFHLIISVILLLTAQQAQQVKGTRNVIVDLYSLPADGGSELCLDQNQRISRISTIPKILEQFDSTLGTCGDSAWSKSVLSSLQEVLEASARDACSHETVEKIDAFHWEHVAGTLFKSWNKRTGSQVAPIPEALRQFFLHFVDETTERCKSNLISRLSQEASVGPESSVLIDTGSQSFDRVSMALVPHSKVRKYEDFFLIFNSIVSLEKKKNRPIKMEQDPLTGEPIYASIRVRDATSAQLIQHKCRQELRPVYYNTVLPLMKLIDLGYGNFGQTINSNDREMIAKWYAITQLCELVVPVKFYASSSIKEDQVVLVDEEEQDRSPSEASINELPLQNQIPAASLAPVHLDDVLPSPLDDKVAKKVKANFKSRSRIYRLTLKNSLLTMKSEIKSRIKSLFVSKRSQKSSHQFDLVDEASISESLDNADKLLSEDELVDSSEDGAHALTRRKRGDIYGPSKTKSMGAMILGAIIVIGVLAIIIALFVMG